MSFDDFKKDNHDKETIGEKFLGVRNCPPSCPSTCTNIHVVAKRVDATHLYIECPMCMDKYIQNDLPSRHAKPAIHALTNRKGCVYRKDEHHPPIHCRTSFRPKNNYYPQTGFCVTVDKTTQGSRVFKKKKEEKK